MDKSQTTYMQGADSVEDNVSAGFRKDVGSSYYETIGTPQNNTIVAVPQSNVSSNLQNQLKDIKPVQSVQRFQNDYRNYMNSALTRSSLEAIQSKDFPHKQSYNSQIKIKDPSKKPFINNESGFLMEERLKELKESSKSNATPLHFTK